MGTITSAEYLPGATTVNGMGEEDPRGSYVRLAFDTPDGVRHMLVSLGGCETLMGELYGLGCSSPGE